MRPLHRPMFRYGGPIKEGVMSGIREPHAGGGRAALVGNPVYPQTGGREHHFTDYSLKNLNPKKIKDKVIVGGMTKILPKVGINPGFLNKPIQGFKNWWLRNKPTRVPKLRRTDQSLPIGMRGTLSSSGITSIPLRSRILPWMSKNKGWTVAGGVGATSEPGQAILQAPFKAAKWTGEALTPKWAEKYLPWEVPGVKSAYKTPWGKDKKEDEKKLTANELRIQQLEKMLAAKEEPEVPQKSDAEIRQEQIQKYRDIMDIKGMNKQAAYKSLIDASKLIQESGDFKGDIKSGKLINQVIQAASKQFDKPKKTKDAIDTLILKGEIEKDLNKDKNAIMDAYRIAQTKLADKQLNESLTETAIKFAGTMKKPYVDQETAIMTIRNKFDVTPNIVLSEKKLEEVKKQDDYKNETDVFTKIVEKQTLGPGYYVMGSSGFIVDEGGNIKQIL